MCIVILASKGLFCVRCLCFLRIGLAALSDVPNVLWPGALAFRVFFLLGRILSALSIVFCYWRFFNVQIGRQSEGSGYTDGSKHHGILISLFRRQVFVRPRHDLTNGSSKGHDNGPNKEVHNLLWMMTTTTTTIRFVVVLSWPLRVQQCLCSSLV